jgi:hypothetical protein
MTGRGCEVVSDRGRTRPAARRACSRRARAKAPVDEIERVSTTEDTGYLNMCRLGARVLGPSLDDRVVDSAPAFACSVGPAAGKQALEHRAQLGGAEFGQGLGLG